MTIGKITSSQQDIVFVNIRPEDDTYMETHNGTVKVTYYIINSVGQIFTTFHWMGRIKIKIGNVTEPSRVRVALYDTPAKTHMFYDVQFDITSIGGCVLHLAFDPLPIGTYFYEIEKLSGTVGVSVVTDSTLHKAYKEGSPTTDWDIESKIMYVTDTEQEKAVAIVGDTVDSGVTTVSAGSTLGKIMVGVVEKNISREDDDLANGGEILTGCWFTELDD